MSVNNAWSEVLNVPPVKLPNLIDLKHKSRVALKYIDDNFSLIPSDINITLRVLAQLRSSDSTDIPVHELSMQFMEAAIENQSRQDTSCDEKIIATVAANEFAKNNSCKSILRIFSECVARLDTGGIRSGDIYSKMDSKGVAVKYPPYESWLRIVPKLIRLVACSKNHPSFSAICLLVTISASHPLRDGNGRLSRLAFNAIMMGGTLSDSYLPLYEIGRMSQGSLVLYIREAVYFHRWDGIISFIANYIKLVTDNKLGKLHNDR